MKKSDMDVILLVDDQPSNLFSLEKLLEKKDRAFLHAHNGTEALKLALNESPDLIILDVQMPGMDGFEVAQILGSKKKTEEIPIIFASASHKEHQSMMKGFDEGAIDYLFKPLDPEITKAKVAVLLKINKQKKELQLKNQSLEKSALLINNSADIIGILDGKNLKFEEINNAFESTLGYPREETLGVALGFFLTAEDRVRMEELRTKDSSKLAFETRVYCKNRSIKWLQWQVVVKDRKWFVNARDITESKEVERIRNYLFTVVKQSNDAVYIHDDEGKIISWNLGAEKIYGYTEAEALQMKIWNIIPEYMQPDTQETMNQLLNGDKFETRETKRITKHGKLVDALFSASVINDPDKEKISIAITERDITQQKIADEQIRKLNQDLKNNITQLESINQELEAFSYSVSHDLRAPLRAIHGFSSILLEDYAKNLEPDALKLLNDVLSNSEKMGKLIEDLLALSKLGRKELTKDLLNMETVIAGALYEINSTVQHDARITNGKLLQAEGDFALIKQVWINLLSNAIKYSAKKETPQIFISSERIENQIIYSIRDNGAGFNMTYSKKLFSAFQRLHSTEEFEGTGIGLAIVKRVINKHGGRVWAEGVENEGATFYFSLPFSNGKG